MKKWAILAAGAALLLAAVPVFAKGGFNEYGYNYTARNFVGTGLSWCRGKFGWTEATCKAYLGIYADDNLVMKWSKAWDDAVFGPDGERNSGDELPWTSGAWCSNEWNGMVPDGSGETWHYKQVWDKGENKIVIIMSHGTYEGEHLWDIHEQPTGYGVERE